MPAHASCSRRSISSSPCTPEGTGSGQSGWRGLDNLSGDWRQPATHRTHANLAYVIYTSGPRADPRAHDSPSGHRESLCEWMQSTFRMNERDCVLQKTEFSFDVSVWEFFAPLIVGARMVVARPGGHHDPGYLVDIIIQHQVTVLQLVPSLLCMLRRDPRIKEELPQACAISSAAAKR